jgi:hypothetical protein
MHNKSRLENYTGKKTLGDIGENETMIWKWTEFWKLRRTDSE